MRKLRVVMPCCKEDVTLNACVEKLICIEYGKQALDIVSDAERGRVSIYIKREIRL